MNDKFSSSFDGAIQVDLEFYGCEHSRNIRKINIEKYSSDKIMEMNSYAFPEKHSRMALFVADELNFY